MPRYDLSNFEFNLYNPEHKLFYDALLDGGDYTKDELATYVNNPVSRHAWYYPTETQAKLLDPSYKSALFGGSVRGGKTFGSLLVPLYWENYCWQNGLRGYSALIIRRSRTNLVQPGGAQYELHRMLSKALDSGKVTYDKQLMTYHFRETDSSISFGHLNDSDSYQNYLGSTYCHILFDELIQLRKSDYMEVKSRKLNFIKGVPRQDISLTNPGPGGRWIYDRYINPESKAPGTIYIPSRVEDNPFMDAEEVYEQLSDMDPVRRKQLAEGDFLVRAEGGYCKGEDFSIATPEEMAKLYWRDETGQMQTRFSLLIRAWDIALTTGEHSTSRSKKGADWTVGVLLGKDDQGNWYILDVVRRRGLQDEIKSLIIQTAENDPPETIIAIERAGMSIPLIDDIKRNGRYQTKMVNHNNRFDLAGDIETARITQRIPLYGVLVTRGSGNKAERASYLFSQISQGKVILRGGGWNEEYMSELVSFTGQKIDVDDQLDATVIGMELGRNRHGMRVKEPESKIEPNSPAWFEEMKKENRATKYLRQKRKVRL